MNDITKVLIKKIIDLNIDGIVSVNEEITKFECTPTLYYKNDKIISFNGDVNYTNWHNGNLECDYFKYDYFSEVFITTQEQADEFFEIVKNYFELEQEKL